MASEELPLEAVEACWLAQFSDVPCDAPGGRLRAVHLIEKQVLKRRGHDPWDPRSWVWACGGPYPGLTGHHGLLDGFKLRIARERLPAAVEELAAEVGLLPWLDRRYGPLDGDSVALTDQASNL